MAGAYPPRLVHDVEPLMRISGLEPLNYQPDATNMRTTFLNIGERCNVAGSIMFKKAIINNDYDTALSIALKQVQQGAHVLDINMDDGLIDGVAAMTKFVNLCISGGCQSWLPVSGYSCCCGAGMCNCPQWPRAAVFTHLISGAFMASGASVCFYIVLRQLALGCQHAVYAMARLHPVCMLAVLSYHPAYTLHRLLITLQMCCLKDAC
jgi:hypothetical protein